MCRQKRFEPYEAFRLGLFHHDFDCRRLDNIISRKFMTKIQKQFNTESFIEMATNKGLFHYHCLDRAIPVPRLYMVCPSAPNHWQCCIAGLLTTREHKMELLEKRLPHTFVTKPLHGAYGKGFYVFRRRKDGFIDHLDNHYNSQKLITFTESTYPAGFIIQQKMENHPEIVELTNCEALQTVRIISFVDNKGNVRLIHAHFKPITKHGIVIDTYIEGLTGNVEVPVDIDSGILGQGNQIVSTGEGIITVENHPITGKPFAGFELPLWREACDIVKNAATQFLPLRALGWDVAMAPDQPYIIEANAYWDPPNQHLRMNEILNLMRDDKKPTDRLNELQQRTISTNT
jgi:hypothetical protein